MFCIFLSAFGPIYSDILPLEVFSALSTCHFTALSHYATNPNSTTKSAVTSRLDIFFETLTYLLGMLNFLLSDSLLEKQQMFTFLQRSSSPFNKTPTNRNTLSRRYFSLHYYTKHPVLSVNACLFFASYPHLITYFNTIALGLKYFTLASPFLPLHFIRRMPPIYI